MRKQLMAGTALAAATMLVAGGTLAADKKMMKLSITVNGYYESVVGGIVDDSQETKYTYTGVDRDGTAAITWTDPTAAAVVALPMGSMDNKKDTSALDTRTDAEIYFNGRATLDNGMKIHAHVQLEGQYTHSDADPIDEHFVSVSGSFGQIILGGTGGAPVKMLHGLSGSWATGVGETLNFDNAWIPTAHAPGPAGLHYNIQHSRLDTGDAEKITYISPKLGGFQIGLTYSPNKKNNDDNNRIDAEADVHDGFEMAANYIGKFGDVGFGIGAGMTSYQGCDGDSYNMDGTKNCKDTGESDWAIAARIDFGGGFRAAIAHKRVTNEDEMDESSLTDAGVRFIQGANSFSLVGSHGEMENTDAQHTAVMASYARALGPGVKWHANVIWNSTQSRKMMDNAYGLDGATFDVSDTNNDSTDYMQQTAKKENSGTALVTGIKVVF